ncbi:glycosyltransferase family 2 protein [Snuella sedimenti]|uniref:Glycosyltransferase family 2 protein n=1 Tax=Snuella sedimenti TaxID=2798802 RepID=A0A8J7IGQ9_9FLAO|nr:glycosyltransferase family 2 protein [Snuella sedimenti]MBJ6367893.1 glycosyltransferase family 2 protein [Snuella sedimenti]
MSDNNLVSIIIPAYNRAHLISNTLKSIQKQTHTNWECIVIDDGSSDNTLEILRDYNLKDSRFVVLFRPETKLKGANTCRNLGLQKAKGDYIMFFDSDDLMAPNHLEVKIKALQSGDYHFVVAQSRYLNNEELNKTLANQYQFTTKDITPINYITHKINWLTCDTLMKSNLAKQVRFNESLMSGQEYNYFCKIILLRENGIFIEEVVTLIRYHKASIRGRLRGSKRKTYLGYFFTYWNTYLEVKDEAPKTARSFLVYRCFRLLGKLPLKERLLERGIIKAILIEFGAKGFYYLIMLYSKRII